MWKKKNINKIIIWAFLWTAIWWLWIFSRTKKWKNFFRKLQDDVKLWLKDMKKTFQNLIKQNAKKKK
jgi:hypothetical protein